MSIGQKITFRDARDERVCTITGLERISPTRVRIGLEQTAYIKEGMELECQINDVDNDSSKCLFTVGSIKAQPIEIKVEAGNILRLYRENARLGHSGSDGKPAGISCTHPDVLCQVMIGHRVFIDDGKIEAIVSSSHEEYLE